ncbi:CHASE2 domain-containing protein [Limnohabitans sp.]|uniref:CHASE2 domain-containing protein n=1 Tax=Limnohabitans sp. TaxID=1907725 RepID=UPI00286FAE42|nr:CHASE2 domain-containing protein [Limnohabitans sp.]
MANKNTAANPRWLELGKFLAGVVFVAFFGFVIECLMEASLLHDVFRTTAARMFAPYTNYWYARPENAQAPHERAVVVNLGASTLGRLHTAWPMSYGQHARVMERIRQAKPAALFVDIQFQATRDDPSLRQLQTVLCAYQADGIPVYLAAGNETTQGRLRPELETLRNDQGLPCFDKVAVAYTPSDIDHIAWSYPLFSPVGGVPMPSAALALSSVIRGPQMLNQKHNAVMGLTWGGGTQETGPDWQASTQQAHGDAAHPQPSAAQQYYCRRSTWQDLVPLPHFLAHPFTGMTDDRPLCPLHESIEAFALTAPKTAEQTQAQAALLHQRVVLYGTTFDAGDFVNTPQQGEIPGVYLHAQATDNLIRHGADWRRDSMGAAYGHTWEAVIIFLVLCAVAACLDLTRILMRKLKTCITKLCNAPLAWSGHAKLAQLTGHPWNPAIACSMELIYKAVKEVVRKLSFFALGLLLAVPASLLMEHVMHISVIGYGVILATCLLGEAFTQDHEVHQVLEKYWPSHNSAAKHPEGEAG